MHVMPTNFPVPYRKGILKFKYTHQEQTTLVSSTGFRRMYILLTPIPHLQSILQHLNDSNHEMINMNTLHIGKQMGQKHDDHI